MSNFEHRQDAHGQFDVGVVKEGARVMASLLSDLPCVAVQVQGVGTKNRQNLAFWDEVFECFRNGGVSFFSEGFIASHCLMLQTV